MTGYANGSVGAGPRTALDGPTPLSGLEIRLEEAPLRGMIALKGDLMDPKLRAAVRDVVGVAPPDVRRAAFDGTRGAYWMAPDELLLALEYEEVGTAMAALASALSDTPHLLADMSDARQSFHLIGTGAAEVLAKGAPVDLHPDVFPIGAFRRTRLGQVAVGLRRSGGAPESFEVFCFRSFADYVWAWLNASARRGSLPNVLPDAPVDFEHDPETDDERR